MELDSANEPDHACTLMGEVHCSAQAVHCLIKAISYQGSNSCLLRGEERDDACISQLLCCSVLSVYRVSCRQGAGGK